MATESGLALNPQAGEIAVETLHAAPVRLGAAIDQGDEIGLEFAASAGDPFLPPFQTRDFLVRELFLALAIAQEVGRGVTLFLRIQQHRAKLFERLGLPIRILDLVNEAGVGYEPLFEIK